MQLHLLNPSQINGLTFEEFEMIADIPLAQETPQHISAEWRLAQNPKVELTKRGIFIDRLSLLGKKGTLPKLLDIYSKATNDEIRKKTIQGTVVYYQDHLQDNNKSEEKILLRNFYSKLMNSKIPEGSVGLVLKGFIDLSSPEEVLKTQQKIDDLSTKVELNMLLGIQFQLASKSLELERIYIPTMVTMLQREKRADLDNMFFGIMNKFYEHLQLTESKELVKKYVFSQKEKYSPKISGESIPDMLDSLTTEQYLMLIKKL